MLARHDEHILTWLSQRPLGGLFTNVSSASSDSIIWKPIGAKESPPPPMALTPRRGESSAMLSAFNRADDEDVARYNPLYKTNYCREFTIHGQCPFQDRCHFAHGVRELRPMPTGLQHQHHAVRSPNSLSDHVYKTELCTVFIKDGSCRYGVRCHFAHGLQELRPRATSKAAKPSGKCQQWSAARTCKYGDACRFQHHPTE